MGLAPLWKRAQGACLPLPPCEGTSWSTQSTTWKKAFTRIQPCWHYDLDSQPPELWEINFWCLSPPLVGILLWWPKLIYEVLHFKSCFKVSSPRKHTWNALLIILKAWFLLLLSKKVQEHLSNVTTHTYTHARTHTARVLWGQRHLAETRFSLQASINW